LCPIVQLDSSYTNSFTPSDPVVGFIGAGNYASRTLIPAFKEAGAGLDTLVSSGGISGVHHGSKMGFKSAATELGALWDSDKINTVAIVTRHDTHAVLVLSALESGNNVFVEKPLALRKDESDTIDVTFRRVNEG
jgi:predicted dehydrogenase